MTQSALSPQKAPDSRMYLGSEHSLTSAHTLAAPAPTHSRPEVQSSLSRHPIYGGLLTSNSSPCQSNLAIAARSLGVATPPAAFVRACVPVDGGGGGELREGEEGAVQAERPAHRVAAGGVLALRVRQARTPGLQYVGAGVNMLPTSGVINYLPTYFSCI